MANKLMVFVWCNSADDAVLGNQKFTFAIGSSQRAMLSSCVLLQLVLLVGCYGADDAVPVGVGVVLPMHLLLALGLSVVVVVVAKALL